MKKLSIQKLLEFRGRSKRGKQTFIENIKSTKVETPSDGGGNYWVTSLSAIGNSYKSADLDMVDEKIDELAEKLAATKRTITKDMYQRNIDILKQYKTLSLRKIRPSGKIGFLKKSSASSLLTIKGLQIEAKPTHVFTFSSDGNEVVGAVWFVSKLNGYRKEEIGMFTDLLYRYLKSGYGKSHDLSSEFCITVDVANRTWINYAQIEKGSVASILTPTLDEINKLM